MRRIIALTLGAASLAGIAYLGFALERTIAFGRRRQGRRPNRVFCPPVSVLKPLHGLDAELYENLCSFCDQDYPEYQVLLGVRSADDPAVAIAQGVIAAFPDRDIRLVIDGGSPRPNLKMANVLNMFERAKHDVIIVADSDVRVDRAYLRAVAAPFADESVGAVTCLYRAAPALAKQTAVDGRHGVFCLGAMFIEEQFAPSVLVADSLNPMDFCLGATMAVTRRALAEIGGFEAVAEYLADDHMLGKLVRRQGLRVELSDYVVETQVQETGLASLWAHEVRWSRTMRAARPLGYSFSFITYALPLAIACAVTAGASWATLWLVFAAGTMRFALHAWARRALGARSQDAPWLIPLRDFLGLAAWGASFTGKRIRWRDQVLTIDAAGRLHD